MNGASQGTIIKVVKEDLKKHFLPPTIQCPLKYHLYAIVRSEQKYRLNRTRQDNSAIFALKNLYNKFRL